MESLTISQAIVLDFIQRYIKKYGYSPTVREICKGVGLSSPATVYKHLQNLKKKNCIEMESYKSRTIKLI